MNIVFNYKRTEDYSLGGRGNNTATSSFKLIKTGFKALETSLAYFKQQPETTAAGIISFKTFAEYYWNTAQTKRHLSITRQL